MVHSSWLYQLHQVASRPYHWWCTCGGCPAFLLSSVRLPRYRRHPLWKRPELWRHLERWEPRAGPADFPSGIAVAILQRRKVTITIIKFPTHSIIGGTSLTFKPLATTFATVTSRLRSGRPLQRRVWAPNLGALGLQPSYASRIGRFFGFQQQLWLTETPVRDSVAFLLGRAPDSQGDPFFELRSLILGVILLVSGLLLSCHLVNGMYSRDTEGVFQNVSNPWIGSGTFANHWKWKTEPKHRI